MEWDGRVAVVTGGSTGIGRATAALLAERGASVVVAARRAERVEEAVAHAAARGGEVLGVPTDIADLASVQRLAEVTFERFGRVDLAFFNAGVSASGGAIDPDLDGWKRAIDINVYGLLHCIKAFVPRMLEQEGERWVLATTSGSGIHGTAYNTPAYAMTKAAEVSIMESLYGQLRDAGEDDVHAGVVVPPLVRTNLGGDDQSIWPKVEQMLRSKGRPATAVEAEQFAPAVLDGIERRSFWIGVTQENDALHMGGHNQDNVARTHEIVRARAESMIAETPPDPYLW